MSRTDRIGTGLIFGALLAVWATSAQAQPIPVDLYTVHFASVSLNAGVQLSDALGEGTCRRDADTCVGRGRLNATQVVGYLCDTDNPSRDLRLAVLYPCTDVTDDWKLIVWDRENEEPADCRELTFENRPAVYGEGNDGALKELRILADASIDDGPVVADLSVAATVRVGELSRKLREVLFGEDNDDMEGPICAASLKGSSVLGSLEIDLGNPAAQSQLIEDAEDGRVVVDRGRLSAGRAFDLYSDQPLD